MSNVIALHQWGGEAVAPSKEERGHRVADVDDGYTRLANELLDALIEADLSKHQYKVMLALVRKTYGFNKSFDRITNTQIAEMTGLPQTRVCTAKNELIDRGLIALEGRKIGPNRRLSEWKQNIPQNRESFPETGNKSFPETGNGHSPKQGHTKDTIQKTKDNTPSSSRLAVAPQDPVAERVIADAAIQTPNGKSWGSADDLTAAQWIYQRVLLNNPTQKTPNWPEWANTVRLMRQLDGRSHREICMLFDWASKDAFWCSNVLSPAKLRKHWDTLTARMVKGPATAASGGMVDPDDTSWIHDDWGY
jgi:phage replication O-like protein O